MFGSDDFLEITDKRCPGNPIRDLLKDKNCTVWMPNPDVKRYHRMIRSGPTPDRCTVIDSKSYGYLVNVIYKDWGRKIPSSGISTIMMALNIFMGKTISIVGFDNNTGKEGKGHYYDPEWTFDTPGEVSGHDWQSENMFIESLVQNNYLVRL